MSVCRLRGDGGQFGTRNTLGFCTQGAASHKVVKSVSRFNYSADGGQRDSTEMRCNSEPSPVWRQRMQRWIHHGENTLRRALKPRYRRCDAAYGKQSQALRGRWDCLQRCTTSTNVKVKIKML